MLGYSSSFCFPVVVQLLKVWVRPYVPVTAGVDVNSVFMGNFNSCKIGQKETILVMNSCLAKERIRYVI